MFLFFAPVDWRLAFFDFSGSRTPQVPDLATLSAQKPILETTSDRIDCLSGRAIAIFHPPIPLWQYRVQEGVVTFEGEAASVALAHAV